MNADRTCRDRPRAGSDAGNGRSGADSLASVWTLDQTLPTSLSARWAAADWDKIVLRDFARIMLNSGAFVVLLGSMAALAARIGNPLMWAGLAAIATGVLVLGWLSHGRSRRRPGDFTAGEIDLIIKNRREVTFGDWDGFTGPDVPREVTAARRADQLARSVLAMRGWSSEQLAGHRIRLDPAGEAEAIRLAARELYDRRCELKAAADDRSIRELDAVRAEWSEHLDAFWSALDSRITAFDQYVQEVIEVAVLIEQSEKVKQLTASLDEHGPRLSVQTVCSEMTTAHLQDLRSELRALESGLRRNSTVHPGTHIELGTDTN